jgi:hypothetical protein
MPERPRLSGSRLLRSYAGDVRDWASGIVRQYEIAAFVLLASALALLIAFGFGIAALFHFVALRYGENTAFAILGGGFGLVAIAGIFTGLALLKRQLPPLPRPQRQLGELKRALAIPAVVQLLNDQGRARAMARDPAAQIIVTAAAALAVGWILAATRSARRGT